MTLNERNWKLVDLINNEVGVFQDNVVPVPTKEELKYRVMRSINNKKCNPEVYSIGYLDKSERLEN